MKSNNETRTGIFGLCRLIIWSDQYHISLLPLFRFVVSLCPHILVQCIEINVRYLLITLKMTPEMVSFGSQIGITSNKHIVNCMSKLSWWNWRHCIARTVTVHLIFWHAPQIKVTQIQIWWVRIPQSSAYYSVTTDTFQTACRIVLCSVAFSSQKK